MPKSDCYSRQANENDVKIDENESSDKDISVFVDSPPPPIDRSIVSQQTRQRLVASSLWHYQVWMDSFLNRRVELRVIDRSVDLKVYHFNTCQTKNTFSLGCLQITHRWEAVSCLINNNSSLERKTGCVLQIALLCCLLFHRIILCMLCRRNQAIDRCR